MVGKLILISGPAAVGKSTVVRRLQSELTRDGELWLAVELDVFSRAIPREWIAWGEHEGKRAETGFAYRRSDDGTIDLRLGPDGRRVLAAFHRSTSAIVRAGVNVACETIVYDERDWDDWRESLSGISALWILLDAPLAVLEGRESANRSSVSQGLARGMIRRTAIGHYDLVADTSLESATDIAARIISLVHKT